MHTGMVYSNRSCFSLLYVRRGKCNELCYAPLERNEYRCSTGKIFKRTLIIFLCGYLLYWFPFFEYNDQHHLVLSLIANTRIFGVLQRIALAYCFASLMLYFLGNKNNGYPTAIILILYWPVMVYSARALIL
jgi:predicted acyltransferase